MSKKHLLAGPFHICRAMDTDPMVGHYIASRRLSMRPWWRLHETYGVKFCVITRSPPLSTAVARPLRLWVRRATAALRGWLNQSRDQFR